MQPVEVLQITQLIISFGAVGGMGLGWYKSAKSQGAREEKMANKVEALTKAVDELKHVIGNGGYSGLRKEIADMKLNCADKMGRIETALEDHRNGTT